MAATTKSASTNIPANGRAEVAEATDDVAAQLSALKTDFAGLAAAIQTLTGAGTVVAKDTAKAKIAEASEAGELAAQQAVSKANESAAAIANYAREKPLVALAAAAGAGLLLGYLTAPRK